MVESKEFPLNPVKLLGDKNAPPVPKLPDKPEVAISAMITALEGFNHQLRALDYAIRLSDAILNGKSLSDSIESDFIKTLLNSTNK